MLKKTRTLLLAAAVAMPMLGGMAGLTATPAEAACSSIGTSGGFVSLTNQCGFTIAVRWQGPNGQTGLIQNLASGRQSQIPVNAFNRNSVQVYECRHSDYFAGSCRL